MINHIKNFLAGVIISTALIICLFAILGALFGFISEVANASTVVDNTNQERAIRGIYPLVENKQLNIIAKKKADDMYRNKYFAHTYKNRNLYFWFRDFKYREAGENLSIGYKESDVVKAWMKSKTHKDNILYKYTQIGVAKREDYIVQLFSY